MSNSKVFSTKLHANEMSGLREFRTIFRVARKYLWTLVLIFICVLVK